MKARINKQTTITLQFNDDGSQTITKKSNRSTKTFFLDAVMVQEGSGYTEEQFSCMYNKGIEVKPEEQ